MGILSRWINAAYDTPAAPAAITSPWSPQDSLVTFAVGEAIGEALSDAQLVTREIALRVPAIKRAHGIHCTEFAALRFQQMQADTPTTDQPPWLTSSASGVSPYHRLYGVGSDLFFWGWACLGFTADMTDALHIPFGLWGLDDNGAVQIDTDKITGPYAKYRAKPIVIPLGYGENGVMVDAIDTIKEARNIEAAYSDRLANPVPLTVLNIPWETWQGWTKDERKEFRDAWISNRKSVNGATAMKPDTFGVDMPGQAAMDLYESGRNAVRLDIANHTSTPASLLEGVRQGGSGGGTDIKYTGVQNGSTANELWRFGLARRMTLAYEGRMSLDDVCPPGMSIRADLTSILTIPEPLTNPTSED